MKPRTFMLVAGEASGDLLASELVHALRQEYLAAQPVITNDYQPLRTSLEPQFFGAGGKRMQEAGVELALDMTAHSVIGLSDVLKKVFEFRRLLRTLYNLAREREPDAIIFVDFSGFNRRLAHAISRYVRAHQDWFHDWRPKLIQYVSPQVWASREGRAYSMAEDYDLLLTLFRFEKNWYARRVPNLQVEFVGHSIVDRHGSIDQQSNSVVRAEPRVLMLPGSRPGELRRHLPVMIPALQQLKAAVPGLRASMVLPDASLEVQVKAFAVPEYLHVRTGGLQQFLATADLAIASTGTVTMECAWFGVPTVAIYKTSWVTFQFAKRLATVKYAAMPNILAGQEVFPEFLQDRATPDNISGAGLDLLRDQARRENVKTTLTRIVSELGEPGASTRAARLIARLVQ